MDRDMDAIRQILLAVGESDERVNRVEGMDEEVFRFNAMLAIQAGLVEGGFERAKTSRRQAPAVAEIFSLTWAGADFLSLAKSDSFWQKMKKTILATVPALSFDLLKKWLEHEAARHLGF